MLSNTMGRTTTNFKTDSHKKNIYMTTTALFSALICITTAYLFHIPVGVNGGYIHMGDALIYLAATILPTPYALVAGALGGLFADLLTAPMWAPATCLIKMLITIPFTSKKDKILNKQNILAVFIAGFITAIGYYLAESIILGGWAAFIASISVSVVQAVGSAILFIVLGRALDQMHFKRMLRNKFKL